jgi:hypothetical protein
MLVLKLLVLMFMGMPIRPIVGMSQLMVGRMGVIVVGIRVVRVMAVAMVMALSRLVMSVAVLVPEKQNHTGNHQSCGYSQWQGEFITPHHHREDRSNERRRGKEHGFLGCTKRTQCQQIKPDREAIAHSSNQPHQSHLGRRRKALPQHPRKREHRQDWCQALPGSLGLLGIAEK